MRMMKKAALLTAAAATVVLVGAGGASANGYGGGYGQERVAAKDTKDIKDDFGGFVFQINECDAAAGTIAPVGGAAPIGDTNIGSTCVNING